MSPPWMIEGARLAAPIVFLGIVERIEPGGQLDEDFVWNVVQFKVVTVFRSESSEVIRRITRVRCLACIHAEPPLIEGVGPSYHSFVRGDRAVIFATLWDGDMESFFVEPGISEQARGSVAMLSSVKSEDLWILKASEATRTAQLDLYERIVEAIEEGGT